MNIFTHIVILFVFGFLPSIIWLQFFLKKDCHPEPRYLISRTFMMGIALAPLAVIAQVLFGRFLGHFYGIDHPSTSVGFFLWAAFVEEAVKFLAVKMLILNNPEFDEPIDAMIYMITAGLGFAAIENMLVLFQSFPNGLQITFQLLLLRFLGATLLHAVACALTGYFLGLAWFYHHHSRTLTSLGIAIATLVHFAFNIIMLSTNHEPRGIIYSTLLIFGVSVLVSSLFAITKQRMGTQHLVH